MITGGASGIGEGLAERFHAEGARHIVVADRNESGARAVADRIGGTGVGLDVSSEEAIEELVASTLSAHGGIDLFVSNAGFVAPGGLESPTEDFQRNWEVHVMSHVYAARAVLPSMISRGGGYLLNTASAAGLLAQIGCVTYSVTKHAAVALAEWIAITHGYQGIRVSVLCPQAVATGIVENSLALYPDRSVDDSPNPADRDGTLGVNDVSDCVMDALNEERFWVLPHPEVAEYAKRKGSDIDRWIGGMQRWQERMYRGLPQPGDKLAD